jgi:hypothetical protein
MWHDGAHLPARLNMRWSHDVWLLLLPDELPALLLLLLL